MKWRWNGPILDPNQAGDPLADDLVEPSDDRRIDPSVAGTPYLIPFQKIDVGIVKFNPDEQKFQDPTLLERANANPKPTVNSNKKRIAAITNLSPMTIIRKKVALIVTINLNLSQSQK